LADALRASIVLAVSALDAFVRTFVVNKILERVSDVTQTLPDKLREQIKEYLGTDTLLDAARIGDLRSRVDKAFRDHFEEQSFQGVKNISLAMRLIGYEDVFKTVAQNPSKNEDHLKRDLAIFTKRRHIIAHCGDYDFAQTPPKVNKISMAQANECIKLVELIAEEIHKLK
jgi:hypothetical protein